MKNRYDLVELVALITHLVGDQEVAFIQQIEAAGITARQLHYLDIIAALDNPTLGELADTLQVKKPSVTAIVKVLVEKGFLKRVDSDQDRRSAHVHLTRKGRQIVDKHNQVHTQIAAIFSQHLSKRQLQQLVTLLNQVVEKAL